MLKRLEIENFKAFDRFTVWFREETYMVGPNNAGKSTLLAALRAISGALKVAGARIADEAAEVDGVERIGRDLSDAQMTIASENLRHDFRQQPTRVRGFFSDDAQVEIYWSPERDSAFSFCMGDGVVLRRPRDVRQKFPEIGVVPVLAPLEPREKVLAPETVVTGIQTRLSSRHARNELFLLQQEDSETAPNRFEEFIGFAAPWMPELTLTTLERSYNPDSLDLYCREAGSRVAREVSWTGDGMQVWMQILLNLFRLRDCELVILDEPDLFLHPDMQRRLVGVLDGMPGQVITATHSPEVLAEARQDSVVWVAKERRRAVRAPEPEVLLELSETLGTHFNLRLAKALLLLPA